MKISSFRKYFKCYFKKTLGFTKKHLDVCQVCVKMRGLFKKLGQRVDLKEKLEYLLQKHLWEADWRYQNWNSDKKAVTVDYVKENVTLIEELEEQVETNSKILN
jgi:hypothetical protein